MEIQEQTWRRVMSPEIVEVEIEVADHQENINQRATDVVESISDVFVAVGKNDLDVVKWAVDHLLSAGARLYLVHVFPPVTHIQTPVIGDTLRVSPTTSLFWRKWRILGFWVGLLLQQLPQNYPQNGEK